MLKRTLNTLLVAAVVAALAVPCVLADDKKPSGEADIVRNLDIFNALYKELNTFYVDTINAQKAMETAIDAMLDDVDPYTAPCP